MFCDFAVRELNNRITNPLLKILIQRQEAFGADERCFEVRRYPIQSVPDILPDIDDLCPDLTPVTSDSSLTPSRISMPSAPSAVYRYAYWNSGPLVSGVVAVHNAAPPRPASYISHLTPWRRAEDIVNIARLKAYKRASRTHRKMSGVPRHTYQ
jgi:hypothetical protein